MINEIHIAGRPIGPDHPPYVIAELSGNHNQSLDIALEMIDVAKQSGADAVKIQTYTPDTITLKSDAPDFRVEGGLWDGQYLYDLYAKAYTPWEWHDALFQKARNCGITIFSSPFDPTAVDLLDGLGAPAFKIASFELVDLPLIAYAASKGKPMIMSTGMATYDEISEAVGAARDVGCRDIVLLHCVSSYPAPAEQSALATIRELRQRFGCIVGLSDHTMGTVVPTAAVALGASVVEKHVTRSRAEGGVDSAFSLEPHELKQLVEHVAIAHSAIGRPLDGARPAEAGSLKYRRSLYAVEDIAPGEELTSKNIRSVRPAYGLAPKHLPALLGRKAKGAIPKGSALDWTMID